jgi:hypothetical protein
VCLQSLPTSTLVVPNTIDTSPGSGQCAAAQPMGWTSAGQPDACFVVGQKVSIGGSNMHARGSRPLVVLATDTLTIADEVDVSAVRDQQTTTLPAGFDPAACANATTPGTNAGGGGGGAGASFIGKGGDGGAGSGVAGGTALTADAPPTTLHAGCRGQDGGAGDGVAGLGGNGGGAVYFVATTIVLTSSTQVHANGAAGSGGGHHAGGGGAGSGGMIVLFADSFTINSAAIFIANGGGGASGGTGSNGMHGNDPSTTSPSTVATGATAPGGHGGDGFAGLVQATPGLVGTGAGGGGGGGGGGYIQANQALSVASSPGVTVP